MEKKAYVISHNFSDEAQNKIQMIKFCIISNFKSQVCKNNLMMFTLDNI
jgi:hypothetical protein